MDQQDIVQAVVTFMGKEEQNPLGPGMWIYDEPLVGFAGAGDELFVKFKQEDIIGPFHRTPSEWLSGAKTVISYFLPFSAYVRRSNHEPGPASEAWLKGRIIGEEINSRLRRFIVERIVAAGGKAVAPVLEKDFVVDYNTCVSNWSERHAAFVAGLGTFSLNRGLITKRGMAGRFGSVITDLSLTPSPRSYSTPFAYCPFLGDKTCGACIGRCPSGAITERGKDKRRCHQYIFVEDPNRLLRTELGYPMSSCGKCQTAVPCEAGIPA